MSVLQWIMVLIWGGVLIACFAWILAFVVDALGRNIRGTYHHDSFGKCDCVICSEAAEYCPECRGWVWTDMKLHRLTAGHTERRSER